MMDAEIRRLEMEMRELENGATEESRMRTPEERGGGAGSEEGEEDEVWGGGSSPHCRPAPPMLHHAPTLVGVRPRGE